MPNVAPRRFAATRPVLDDPVSTNPVVRTHTFVVILCAILAPGCATVNKVSPAVEYGSVHTTSAPATIETPGLCLSGGGYRAMLFHAGVALRLYEVQQLESFNSLSGVSGGAITAAWLGLRWNDLYAVDARDTQRFNEMIIEPLRLLARETIDVSAIAKGVLLPGSASGYLADALDERLFRGATLANLPEQKVDGDRMFPPLVILNATNLLTGRPWVFTRYFMGDYSRRSAGPLFMRPNLKLAVAVAASAAFPPFLAPVRLDVSNLAHETPIPVLNQAIEGSWMESYVRRKIDEAARIEQDYFDLIQKNIPLVDGGVGGNLGLELCGLETAQAFVSSAIAFDVPQLEVGNDWFSVIRAATEYIYARAEAKDADIIRERNTINFLYQSTEPLDEMRRTLKRTPMYAALSGSSETLRGWTHFRQVQYAWLRSSSGEANFSEFVGETSRQTRLGLAALRALADKQLQAVQLASVPTRLATLDECTQEHLINWGYVMAEMAMNVRVNWRAFRKGNYELVQEETFEKLDEKIDDLGTLPRFRLPFKLHPALQTLLYAAIESGEPPPLPSACAQSPTFVIPPRL